MEQSRDAQIASSRADVAQKLKDLTDLEDSYSQEQKRRFESEADVWKQRLSDMVDADTLRVLLNDPSLGLVANTAAAAAAIGSLDTNLNTALTTANEQLTQQTVLLQQFLTSVISAQSGLHAINTSASHLILTHPHEDIHISKHGEPYAVPMRSESRSESASAPSKDGDVNVNLNLGDIKTYLQNTGYAFRDAQQFTDAVQTLMIQSVRPGGRLRAEILQLVARKQVGRR